MTFAASPQGLLRGVCPVLEVPFTSEGAIDPEGFAAVARHVAGTEVSAVMWPGFASEFLKLSENESATLRATLLAETAHRADLAAIVSVADHATYHAVRRAVEAAELGADALNLLPPYLMNPSSPQVVEHIAAVLRAVSPLPVVLQHAPALTGSALTTNDILGLAADHDNLVMVKVEAVPPGPVISALAQAATPIPSMVGYAGVLLADALRRGVTGVQPGCSFVEIYQAIWQLWHQGDQDDALGLYQRLLPYVSYWMTSAELIVAAEKRISRERGWFASDHCRSPRRELDTEERATIDRFLAEFDDLLSSR